MKIIFAGTPDFAATALKQLIAAGHEIALVLSQPDRPSGRGMKLTASPVKEVALEHGIEVLTPVTLSVKKAPQESQQIFDRLHALEADVLIVAAYGLILPEPVLNCAKGIGVNRDIKAINIHGSLPPRWRGAAPVARAIEAGDAETGVMLMKMELGLDTGPVIATARTPITDTDTGDTLMDRLARLGADLLVEKLQTPYELTWTAQSEEGVLYAEKLQKSESLIDWRESAEVIARKIRAHIPFPGSQFRLGELNIKVWEAHPVDAQGTPGEVLDTREALVVACGTGALAMTVLQKPGKQRMPFTAFLQSQPLSAGMLLDASGN